MQVARAAVNQTAAQQDYRQLNPSPSGESDTWSRRDALFAATLACVTADTAGTSPAFAAALSTTDVYLSAAPCVVAVGTVGAGAPRTFTCIASGIVWGNAELRRVVTAYSPVNAALRQQRDLYVAVQSSGGVPALFPACAEAREPSLNLMVLDVDFPASAFIQPAMLASSDALRVGQYVVMVGSNPDGTRAASSGVLSAKGRTGPAPNGQLLKGLLQTDAEVTASSLGGALFDSAGHLVGMATGAYTSQQEGNARSAGVNFALSSDTLLAAVPRLISYGNLAGRR